MTIYLDTSVLVAAFSEEEHSERAQAFLQREEHWLISDWSAAEFSAAIRTKARRGDLALSLVPILDQAIDEIANRAGGLMPVRPQDMAAVRDLVILDGRVRAPDALHLVLARRLEAAMATFDMNLLRAAGDAGLRIATP